MTTEPRPNPIPIELKEEMVVVDRCSGCGVDMGEFPEMKHSLDECPRPECTCYEHLGGHQMGCPLYPR